MNIYASWWNQPLTIYNKHTDSVTSLVTWYRHTIKDCFWKYTGNKVNINDNVIETNDIICRIPKKSDFLENYEWLKIPNDEKKNYFTLNKGDIIVRGFVDDDINEYAQGQRSNDLIKKYKNLQGCMVVNEFTINVDGGRCNEHYYVKGE